MSIKGTNELEFKDIINPTPYPTPYPILLKRFSFSVAYFLARYGTFLKGQLVACAIVGENEISIIIHN